jgi:hypothetical protein
MIPESAWLKTPLPKGSKGQVLVRMNIGDAASYSIVPARCPQCQLGSYVKFVTGWMFLHPQSGPKDEQSAKLMDLTLAKPSTQILENSVVVSRRQSEMLTESMKTIQEKAAGWKYCFMCQEFEPKPDWIQLASPSRYVCSERCFENYCNGADLT